MKSSTIVTFAQLASSPWRNGLGTTTQLAVHPPEAGSDDFEWRVSIARLDATAPFSIYPGVERCLAVLQGEMTMVRPAQPRLTLTPESQPVRFAGSEAVEGHVVRGPVLDLNAMCKSSRWRATLRRMHWSADATVSITAPAVLCSLSNQMSIELDGSARLLDLYDAVLVQRDALLRIAVSRPAAAYLIEFQRQQ